MCYKKLGRGSGKSELSTQHVQTLPNFSPDIGPKFRGFSPRANHTDHTDRLCGLVVRVSGYRYRGPGFDPRRYQIFWVVVGLERGPLSLVRSNWGATWIKNSGFRFRKQRLTAVGTRCANHVTPLYPQKLALTSPTGGGRFVGMI